MHEHLKTEDRHTIYRNFPPMLNKQCNIGARLIFSYKNDGFSIKNVNSFQNSIHPSEWVQFECLTREMSIWHRKIVSFWFWKTKALLAIWLLQTLTKSFSSNDYITCIRKIFSSFHPSNIPSPCSNTECAGNQFEKDRFA